jgi:hypothetical protein
LFSPGSLNFESAPFKLTPEYVEVMGGAGSTLFTYYKDLLFRGFMEARKYHEKIILILEMWLINSKVPSSVLSSPFFLYLTTHDTHNTHNTQHTHNTHTAVQHVGAAVSGWR